MTLSIVPARGGSKRIPRKNLRPFCGSPAISRIIRLIAEADIASATIVSTDDPEIADLARSSGALVPGFRPTALSDDHTTTAEVVRHVLREWAPNFAVDEPVVVVYPTALLLDPQDLAAAVSTFLEQQPQFLMPVLQYRHPVERRVVITERGRIRPVNSEHANTRTQDLPVAHHDAGQFYIGSAEAWINSAPMLSEDTVAYRLSSSSVVDIDTEDDWKLAEFFARHREGFAS